MLLCLLATSVSWCPACSWVAPAPVLRRTDAAVMISDREADDLEERLVKQIMAQRASGAEWDASMVAGMEADLSRLSKVDRPMDPPTSSATAVPRKGTEPWGCWEQTSDGKSVSFELIVDGATRAADIRCECLVGFLDVRCKDEPVLSGRLAQQVLPQELNWALDESADGQKLLCIDLPKRDPANFDAIFQSVRVGDAECFAPGLVKGRILPPE
jgi:hypothetical protein